MKKIEIQINQACILLTDINTPSGLKVKGKEVFVVDVIAQAHDVQIGIKYNNRIEEAGFRVSGSAISNKDELELFTIQELAIPKWMAGGSITVV